MKYTRKQNLGKKKNPSQKGKPAQAVQPSRPKKQVFAPVDREDAQYVLFNKPYGVLSQFTPDQPGQRTLAEFSLPKGLYAAGRLDQDSEGLLLLTNDNELIHQLLTPSFGHERTYAVQVEGIPTEEVLEQLRKGVVIQDYKTRPAKAQMLDSSYAEKVFGERNPPIRYRKDIPTSWIELTLTEGKNRQVRRMTAAVGYPTLRLIRTKIGVLTLGDLKSASWRMLTTKEIDRLHKAL